MTLSRWLGPRSAGAAAVLGVVGAAVSFGAALDDLAGGSTEIPQGAAYRWHPALVSLHVLSGALIAIAFIVIATSIVSRVKRGRRPSVLQRAILGGGVLVVACAVLHFVDVITVWFPYYWLSGATKAAVAATAVGAAIALRRSPGILALVRDLPRTDADARARQRAIRDNAALAAAVDASDAPFISLAADGTISRWNRGAQRVYGYGPDEMIGQSAFVLVAPDAQDDAKAKFEALRRGERIVEFETKYVRKDGALLDVSVVVTSSVDEEGAFMGCTAVHRDVTESRRADYALRQEHEALERLAAASSADLIRVNEALSAESLERSRAEERFRAAIEQAPTAMVIVDTSGRIEFVNAQAERMFGYERSDLLGQALEIIVPDRFRADHPAQRHAFVAEPQARAMAAGRAVWARHRDGHDVPVEVALSTVETSRGAFVMATVADLTERRRIEDDLRARSEELARSNSELEQFAYVASHALQEPLRMVASFAQLLKRRYAGKLDKDADEYIQFAVDGATRMQGLIRDLLAYSRVGRGNRAAQVVATSEAVATACENLRALIQESEGSVTCDPLPPVLADPIEVVQLFQNLVGNALKFRSETPPQVHIEAHCVDHVVEMAVRDNGVGMDPNHTSRIFQVFQRLHTRNEYPGSGIGLAICKKIVQRHGGTISVESAPGCGSTFRFTLPAAPDAAAS